MTKEFRFIFRHSSFDIQYSLVLAPLSRDTGFMRLVFVCTGNTCRSPLAVAAWRAFGAPLLREKGIESSAVSAGLAASPGAPVSPYSRSVARDWDVDLSGHRAQRLSDEVTRDADFFVAMTAQHADALRARFGDEKVLQLGAFEARAKHSGLDELQQLFGDEPGDILDPIGGSFDAYQECGAHIRRAVEGLAIALRDGQLTPK